MTTRSGKIPYRPARSRRILCIFPHYSRSFGTFHHAFPLMRGTRAFMPPQGILVVAAWLPATWEVRFVDENAGPARDEDFEWSDVVFISGMHIQRPAIRAINERAHRHGRITVLGGPSVSGCPEVYPDVDILHIGELGDATEELVALLGASVRRPDHQVRLETRERIPLESFPVPAYPLVRMETYFLGSIQFSSGCPYRCEFCDIPELYGRNPRLKTPEQVTRELDAMLAAGRVDAVYFVDDNFVGNRNATAALLPHLVEWQRRRGYPVEFACEATLNIARSPSLLEMMREAKFHTVFCGIESPDIGALQAMAKKQNLSIPVLEAVETLNRHGMEVVSGIIMGLDTDTPETADRILDFIGASKIPMLTINLLHALPRTPLWRRLEAAGRLVDEERLESNVRFLMPYEQVVERWRYCIGKAYEPGFLFDRFAWQVTNTYPNRFQAPVDRRATPENIQRGLGILGRMLWRVGVRADYRGTFWRFASRLLRSGDIESLVHAGIVAHHLIEFAREGAAGRESASFYSQRLPAAQDEGAEQPPRLAARGGGNSQEPEDRLLAGTED